MKKNVPFILFIVLYSSTISGQPACESNPVASDFCSNATPICNLNGYCGNTSPSYTAYVSSSDHTSENNTPLSDVFCASIQNNSWLKFIADSTTAVFDVWVRNCANNNGIQIQIYHTTDCYHFVSVSNCWNPRVPTNGQIVASGLVPGEAYYFMIDGTNGDICDYVIAANTGVSASPVISADQSVCSGNGVTISASNGNSYLWSSLPFDATLVNQATSATIHVNPEITTVYTVTVTKTSENLFCPVNDNVLSSTVVVNPVPGVTTSTTDEHCFHHDGTAFISAAGGTAPYSFHWNTEPQQQTSELTGLASGLYTVTVSDVNGCAITSTVTVQENPNLEPSIAGPSILCEGNSAQLDAGSGYTSYLWSTGSSSQSIAADSGGVFAVTVTDGYACFGSSSILISVVPLPVPLISGPDYICNGSTVTLDAGDGASAFIWSTGETTRNITVMNAGRYSVTVTDTNGCSSDVIHQLVLKNVPVLQMTSKNETCDKADGSASVNASGGEGSYIYVWNDGQTGSVADSLVQGIYTVKVNDDFCSDTASVTVMETPGPEAQFSYWPPVRTILDQPVTFYFHDNSTGSIVDRIWCFGDDSTSSAGIDVEHAYVKPGNFQVAHIVTDTNECTDTLIQYILVEDIFPFYIPNAFTPNGDGVNDRFAPKGENVDPLNFHMLIYDRWGNLIFETDKWEENKSESWNGTKNNEGSLKDIVMGVYMYKIFLKDIYGHDHEYTGYIVLIP